MYVKREDFDFNIVNVQFWSVVSYMAFVWSLFIPHVFSFSVAKKIVLCEWNVLGIFPYNYVHK